MVRRNTKLGEMLYVQNQDSDGYHWLIKKPFSLEKFVPHYFIDFGLIISHLDLPYDSLVLDVGCGSGWHSDWLAQCGYRVYGLDISMDMLITANHRLREVYTNKWVKNIDFNAVCGDSEAMPFRDRCFDGVLFYDVLHHIPHWDKALTEAYRVLKHNGRLIIIDPSVNHYDTKTMVRYGVLERGLHPFIVKSHLKDIGFLKVVVKIEPLWLKTEIGTENMRCTENVYLNEFLCALGDIISIGKRLKRKYFIIATK